ncbi:acyltransferase family protein [Pseudonocardia endophytica]|uniref:Fucose 4-O-acetylase-like acetyltransferase n=1 Tax=Pseudonocardia endophytica TaxID=401976 RepID=A0A4R1HNV1_PSEEN|nr:acyltransferase family protein [Pseudonocardia endophytica]TCK22881.1 fucose 4-O-acetylase-like acetyltransferase [Pseudonocardia endophytica]
MTVIETGGAATAPRPTTTPPRASRTAWLDNVRVWLTVLVLAHHAALTYSDLPLWPYWEQPRDGSSVALDALVAVNQSWFMGLFFLIAGYFAPSAVDRHGAGGFVRGRLLRLGVPYVLFALVLSPIFRYPGWADGGGQATGTDFPTYMVRYFDSGPLWFVLVLLVFSLVYAAVRAFGAGVGETRIGRTPGIGVVLGLGLALGVVSWVWMIGTPNGSYWTVVGLPSPSYLPQYAGAFVVGLLAARRQWLRTLRVRTAWTCAPIALGTIVGQLAVQLAGGPAASGGGSVTSLVAAVCGGVFAATTMVVVLVLFRQLLDRDGPVWTFLSGQAFAVYVLHAPILVWLGVALGGFAAPAAVKALILLAVGIPVCWSAAWLLRRIPLARRVF